MAGRLAWWTVPAGLVVLARVLTLASPQGDGAERDPGGAPVAAAAADPGPSPASFAVAGESVPVVLQDAAGRRTEPRAQSRSRALVLQLPAAAAGQRVGFRLERYLETGAAPVVWLEGRPNIRAGAEMRISGLPDGRYAIAVTYQDGAEQQTVSCREFDVPGRVELLR